ncbi:type II toxin-antitoxin system VapC family toxin [Marispirochaeta sp.]|uniref:type II toxin-antitoxin system tRNA(fMet)-specific endonuclease VapC n=1 Tax=Marispirochaeta sp. TaxID=2038653 RepID=UPI0029C71358|nr:type II toxin-antitoxin system VapC family toxin [Marispirochaeta sp.]
MKYLLDTNICIYILNNKYRSILDRIENEGIEKIALSTMTIAELALGVEKSQKKDKNKIALMEFLLPFSILDFNQNDAYSYAKIRADLEKKGNIIGNMDLLIGSQALSRGLCLVTNNEKEFERIERIEIENWITKI